MKRIITTMMIATALFLIGCMHSEGEKQKLQNVGILFEADIDSSPWNIQGYHGLQALEEQLDIQVYYEENINFSYQIIQAVDEFVKKDVNLVFGHGSSFGRTFTQLSERYPHVHFVYFNGGYFNEQVTSINIHTYAMSFFNGMLAGKMTETNEIGIIAEKEWQAEIEGFYEGVKYQNPEANIHINVINHQTQESLANSMYETIKDASIDVIYPVSDMFSEQIIEAASKDGIYSIGYVSQPQIENTRTLVSMILQIDKIYVNIAEAYDVNQLTGGIVPVDFQSGVIALGEFHSDVPEDYQQMLKNFIESYIDTHLLPHER